MSKAIKKKAEYIEKTAEIIKESIITAKPEPQEEFFKRIKHSCNLGDIVSSLPCVKRYWELTHNRVEFCQIVNMAAAYYPGATHPTTDESGQMVCVNNKMFEMMKPLMEAQPYIKSFVQFTGQKIDLDFDVIRGQMNIGMPNLMIQSWLMFAYPDLDYDLSKTWIDLPEEGNEQVRNVVDGKIILNFTDRYRISPSTINHYFLQRYSPDLMFAGTEQEHFKFCNRWNLNIPRLEVSDFLEYAFALKYSRFLVSNQSFGWNLATAIGSKRILEVCSWAANCQPFIGEWSKGYQFQTGLEHYFRRFYNDTK